MNSELRTENAELIRGLLNRVRARWRALVALRAFVRGALIAAVVVGAALIATRWTDGAPVALMAVAASAALLAAGALAWCLAPLRRAPADSQVARFIEERAPSLGDRLVTAVDVSEAADPPALAGMMIADAARRSSAIEVDAIVSSRSLRRAGLAAAAAAAALGIVLFASRGPARQAVDAASLTLFPGRVDLDVTPGNARVKAGSPIAIQARLVGNRAPIIAQVQIADGDRWRVSEMASDGAGSFRLALPSVGAPFTYRVVAGAVTSPTYAIAVAIPPRVKRIDVHYSYPAGLRLAPRTETDGGDIYAPAGTDVRVQVFTDRPAATGQMTLGGGQPIALTADTPTELSASLKVTSDDSYRLILADRDGIGSPGDTEYFIRTLEDRPPDVRVLKPATDRSVTRLEEVDIEAQAEDDYGVDRLDLVYAVKGGAEKVVPLAIPRASANVTGRHTLFLEELDVQPGDFVSYYVRARDLTRGTRPNEARSDIFFLEVKPYEQEFALAQSQGSNMPGGNQSGIDDLVAAQKEIVVATWKLDRRARAAKGGKSEVDIKAVSRAEAELKTRVEQTSSSFREGAMRDPKRRPQPQPQRGRGPTPPPQPPAPPELKAGETLPEEDQMTAAVMAMARAVTSLDGLKTDEALPPEMEALNRLLKAQADVKKREVQRQQSGSGSGNNRSNYDVSSLFDKELQKAQQTNYETKSSAVEEKNDGAKSALDAIKELARRQDELLKRQEELARTRAQMSGEELKRELEKLTREQSELRQKAEELAQKMQGQQGNSQQSQSQSQKGQDGKDGQKGQQGQDGKAGQAGQAGSSGQSGQQGQSGDSKRMRDVSEEMRNAASELRRQDPGQASARGNRALEKLREMQQQLESARPDDRRRALGEMQLEARQLADAEKQIASELAKTAQGDAGKDAVRRLAGEQDRLADRARKLQEALKSQGAQGARGSQGAKDAAQAAAGDVARDLERQRLSERMRQAADAMRAATDDPKGGRGNTASRSSDDPRAQSAPQQELAKALEKAADRLASASGSDGESQKLSEQRARAQELRERLNETSRALGQLAQQGDGQAGRAGEAGRAGRAGQSGPSGQRSGASASKSPGDTGKAGEGQAGGGAGTGSDLEKLRQQYQKQLQDTKALADQMRREDPGFARGGGGGFSFDAPTSIGLSAPGTEAFKQDFAKWEEMRRQATQVLDNVETSLSKKIQAKQAHDRLAAGADDKAPAGYQKQVDDYFKAIAGNKRP